MSVTSSVPQRSGTREFSAGQLKLIRRTIARKCSDSEFDQFVAVATQCGLDPLRRQITPLILNPNDVDKRELIPWTTIDGLRVIAARQGDYRPMETAPLIEHQEGSLDQDRNPLGIVRAEVRAWKASDGAWHPVVGEAWWEEYAPLHKERANGAPEIGGGVSRLVLDTSWRRMGRVMIAKCAEAQALRRGWPDLLSGLYGEEELQRLRLADQTATELLRQADDNAHRRQLSTRTLWFVFETGGPFEPVKLSDVFARLQAFYDKPSSAIDLERFDQINRASLQTLWEWAPADAFNLKRMSEMRRQEALQRQEAEGAQPTAPFALINPAPQA